MNIHKTTEKRRLIVTIGEGDAVAGYQWQVVNFFRDDSGADQAPPQNATIDATAAEVAAYIGQAAAAHPAAVTDAIERVKAENDRVLGELRTQHTATVKQMQDEVEKVLKSASEKIATVTAERDMARNLAMQQAAR